MPASTHRPRAIAVAASVVGIVAVAAVAQFGGVSGGARGKGDKVKPTIVKATLPGATTSRAVTLKLKAKDNKASTQLKVHTQNENSGWSGWKSYSTSLKVKLSDGYGAKAVRVQVKDAAGNKSDVLTANTIYTRVANNTDTTKPVVNSIKLAPTSTSQTVTVTIDASDDSGSLATYRIANEDGIFPDARTPFATSVQHKLSPGNGYKTISVEVYDAAGNWSDQTTLSVAHTTVGPPTPPDSANPVLTSLGLPTEINSADVTTNLVLSDDVGVTRMSIAYDDGNFVPSFSFLDPYSYTFHFPDILGDGSSVGVTAKVYDAAHHESNWVREITTYYVTPSKSSTISERPAATTVHHAPRCVTIEGHKVCATH